MIGRQWVKLGKIGQKRDFGVNIQPERVSCSIYVLYRGVFLRAGMGESP
jgi:hypothetical protein